MMLREIFKIICLEILSTRAMKMKTVTVFQTPTMRIRINSTYS